MACVSVSSFVYILLTLLTSKLDEEWLLWSSPMHAHNRGTMDRYSESPRFFMQPERTAGAFQEKK